MRWLIAILLLGCGKSDRGERDKPRGAHDDARPDPRDDAGIPPLHAIGTFADASLVAGTRRIAVRAGDHWYEPVAGRLVEKPIGAAIARERAALGGVVDVHLGSTPILTGGEEHREVTLRLAPERTPIDLEGELLEVATTRGGVEIWHYRHQIWSELAVVTGSHAEPLERLANLGPAAETSSPVTRRKCERPEVVDIDAAGDAVVALVVECSDRASVRVVSYEFPGPTIGVKSLPPQNAQALAVSKGGDVVVAGVDGGKLAFTRGGAHQVTGLACTRVLAMVIADDGAAWTLTVGDAGTVVAREAVVQRAAESLALDGELGVVVLSGGKLFAER